jgi:hypothetical protein
MEIPKNIKSGVIPGQSKIGLQIPPQTVSEKS